MRDISISFGGIKAVDQVSVDLYPGEVVGLLGHNGAGKSTLIKVLSGAYQMDHGQILIDGKPVEINNPRDERANNIETIYQTLALADNLDATSNLFADEEMHRRFSEEKPLGRLGEPEDVAEGVRYLAGPESSWVTGQSFAIEGGNELRKAPDMGPMVAAIFGDDAFQAVLEGRAPFDDD